MDYKSIQELIKTVSDSKLTSFEIESEGIHIKMNKLDERTPSVSLRENNIHEAQTNSNEVLNEVSFEKVISDSRADENRVQELDNTSTIKSPIVGTFYASSSPEEDPFVTVGSKVKKGDTLCIIEAMKLMNEVEAEEDYEIVEILVENEDMVEYGQPLFRVKK
ncbi:MAG: acetyl-CoA carboxylase biotin carboxyl carrier protein [Clostridium sp.]|nr:acetyl-CoA carboxylase biotin carboxyl carrier protein [Clostridium sp.]